MSTTQAMPMASTLEEEPLLSNRLLLKTLVFLLVMALLTGGVVVGGHWLGKRITLAGHTDNRDRVTLTIGRDTLSLPQNVLRFETERHSGTAERADLYFTWPEMQGFSRAESDRFNDINRSRRLIFVQITQSIMSRDMSGRIEPIYAHYYDGEARDGGNGLLVHRLQAQAGYDQDVLLTAPRPGQTDYAVRCVLPKTSAESTGGDCQRDIFAGKDLSVLYRFSSDLLPDWKALDAAVSSYVAAHLAGKQPENP
nr:hypothetical protein [uncultured Gellertiella sp.]